MAKTGSIGSIQIDSISFDVAADADLGEIITEFKNSLIVSSGRSIVKQEKQSQNIDGVVLITSGSDRIILKDRADSGDEFPITYTKRSGDRVAFVGQMNVDKHQTMESRTSIELLPMSKVLTTLKK